MKSKYCFWLEEADNQLIDQLAKTWGVKKSSVVRAMIRFFRAYPEKLGTVEIFAYEEERRL